MLRYVQCVRKAAVALRLRYVDLVVSIQVAVAVCCCFTVFSCSTAVEVQYLKCDCLVHFFTHYRSFNWGTCFYRRTATFRTQCIFLGHVIWSSNPKSRTPAGANSSSVWNSKFASITHPSYPPITWRNKHISYLAVFLKINILTKVYYFRLFVT
jgi:hypothetical protein